MISMFVFVAETHVHNHIQAEEYMKILQVKVCEPKVKTV